MTETAAGDAVSSCTSAGHAAVLIASAIAPGVPTILSDSSWRSGNSLLQAEQTHGAEAQNRPFTPRVPPDVLQRLLRGYDADLAARLVLGFLNGFSTGCQNPPTGRVLENLSSCVEAPHVVDAYIQRERQAGRVAGPFPKDFSGVKMISPIGLIPKKEPGSFRVIHHLSFPAGSSVNDYIPRECTTVTYGSVDEAVQIIADTPNPYLAKTDVKNAFRLIPIRPEECSLLGFSWRDLIYTDLAMPMGCSSSSQTFQVFSDALVWIAQNKFGVGHIVCVLDDFLFIDQSRDSCKASLQGFQEMCRVLHVPLRPGKTVEPCQCLTFLGVTLDAGSKELRLPPEKVRRGLEAISKLLPCKKAKLQTVQSCIGLLSFACIAVPLGRTFLRRLYDLCRGIRRPYHRVTISREARLDLRAWQIFLSRFNCRSMIDGRRWHRDPGLLLETDASGSVGFGAICGSAWLFGKWPVTMQNDDIGVKELAAVVVAVTTWRERLAHRCVLIRSDNAAVVACSPYVSLPQYDALAQALVYHDFAQ